MNEWSCQDCGGSGLAVSPLSYDEPCSGCDGSGTERDYDDTGDIEGREERERILAAWA